MKTTIAIAFALILFSSCDSPKGGDHADSLEIPVAVGVGETTAPGKYAHSVFVWLKNPEREEDRSLFEASMKKFAANIPYATSIHFGAPIPSERDVVDDSFTYSFLIRFSKESDLATYDKDHVHMTFREETAALWRRVVIYDSVNLME